MRLAVLGATGGTGAEVVGQALDAGHEVTAVVRSAARLAPGIAARAAEVAEVADQTDERALRAAFDGRDAVLSALGTTRKGAGAVTAVTRAATAAMAAAGVGRIVVVSAVPVGPVPEGEGLFHRAVLHPLISGIFRDVYRDLAAMEAELRGGGTDWTVIRPPRLVDAPLTGRYRREIGGNVRGGRTLARADLAHAMLGALTDPATFGRAVGVAY
ncbi:NAD(P)-dependent oxidoreductase [Streptomyces radicis]|uniref:Epimerase n=1 Tax=Streptomyces radicis TaxID=1750517 RepID=A0A3A9WFJ7_9ACTN|nr:NAD(P)H-binding protein [Streptomyces radicis]RKN11560.1 epimerase [Streptomyces radicis]RKN26422.1 epimerase [Streptomyces radicis]